MKIVKQSATLINPFSSVMTDKEYFTFQLKNVEKIARVCYKSEDKITDDSYISFVRGLIKRNHMAMLEHGSFSILFVTDRGISHEIVRHRLASFAQESTRYCNYANGKFNGEISIIAPLELPIQDWLEPIVELEFSYKKMLSQGIKPQIARNILPTALKTEIVMTANFREWIHFLRLRTAKDAHPQIQEVANQVLEMLKKNAPLLVEDF